MHRKSNEGCVHQLHKRVYPRPQPAVESLKSISWPSGKWRIIETHTPASFRENLGMVSCILVAPLYFKSIRMHIGEACPTYFGDTHLPGIENTVWALKDLDESSNINRKRLIIFSSQEYKLKQIKSYISPQKNISTKKGYFIPKKTVDALRYYLLIFPGKSMRPNIFCAVAHLARGTEEVFEMKRGLNIKRAQLSG